MIGVVLRRAFLVATLETRGEILSRIGGVITTKQVQTHGEPAVEIALDHVERDTAHVFHVFGLRLHHQFAGPLYDSRNSGLTDKEVMGFFGQHELR